MFFKKVLISLFSCVFLSLFLMPTAQAQNVSQSFRIPWENNRSPCWVEAARYHNVDPWLLYAMANVESKFNPSALNTKNKNGTRDIGLMQINSSHLEMLRRQNISEHHLMNACASTFIGAWVLSEKIKRYGYSWRAVAAYNVGSLNTDGRVATGRRYAGAVHDSYVKLTQKYGVDNGASRVWAVN